MKEYVSSISPKGQITIPLEVRQQFGVKPKDKVVIRVEGDQVSITLANRDYTASFRAVPALARRLSVEEMTEIAHEEQAEEVVSEGLGR